MEVRVGVTWQVVIDGQIDALDINTTTKDISSDADTLVEVLEFFVAFDPIFSENYPKKRRCQAELTAPLGSPRNGLQ